jgi:hypothetical protein
MTGDNQFMFSKTALLLFGRIKTKLGGLEIDVHYLCRQMVANSLMQGIEGEGFCFGSAEGAQKDHIGTLYCPGLGSQGLTRHKPDLSGTFSAAALHFI